MAKETIAIVIDGQDNASDDIQRVQRNMQNMNSTANQASGSMGQVGTAASGTSKNLMVAATATTAVIGATVAVAGELNRVVGELNEVGIQSKQTTAIFQQLAGGIEESTNLLNQLRSATGGVVDDTTLMAGANRLMRMGLAESAAEVTQLVDAAITLKNPTETAAEAIDNFSLMLANESVARLDSFGISAAAVRLRMEELIETGEALNRSDAFKIATIEEYKESLKTLGEVADISQTSLARVQAEIENRKSTIAEGTAGLVESAAVGLEYLGYALRGQMNLFGAPATPEDMTELQANAMRDIISGALTYEQFYPIVAEYAGDAINDPRLIDMLENTHWIENAISVGMLVGEAYAMTALEGVRPVIDEVNDLLDFSIDMLPTLDVLDPTMPANIATINAELDLYMQKINALEQSGQDVTELKSAVQDLKDVWGGVTNAVNGSIAALSRIQGMNLNDLLGRGAGDQQQTGLVGMLLGQISDSDLRSTLQSEFELLTGQETNLGQVVEEEISAQIAEVAKTVGTTAAFGMVEAVQNALQTGEFLGLDQDEIIEMVRSATMASTPRSMLMRPSGGYTVQPGDSPWSILSNMGIPASEIPGMVGMFNQYGTLQPGMQIGLPGMGGGMGMLPSDAILATGGMLGAPALEPIESLVSDEAQTEIEELMQDFEAIDIKMNQIRSAINLAFRDRTMTATVNIRANVSADDKKYIDWAMGSNSINNLGQAPLLQPGTPPPSGGGGTNQ